MKQIFYGEIDLTKLGRIVREHGSLVKEVKFKDGIHKLIKVEVKDKEKTDNYGNTACLKVACKQSEEQQQLNYFLGDLKPSKQNDAPKPKTSDLDTTFPPLSLPPLDEDKDDLPF